VTLVLEISIGVVIYLSLASSGFLTDAGKLWKKF
jgi:hypothetical protein